MWSFDLLKITLVILTLAFFFLTIYSILRENSTLLNDNYKSFLSLKILDTSSSATLFVTLLGALVVRHQFALSLRPQLSYVSKAIVQHDNQSTAYEVWQVSLRNTGLGAAIISQIHFDLEPSSNCKSRPFIMDEVMLALKKYNLTCGIDYWLDNFSEGFTLPPNTDCRLFEIKKEHLNKIESFNVRIFFQGFLGDRYTREVFVIPRTAAIKTL